MRLSYSECTGFFTRDEGKIDESNIRAVNDPYNYFTEKNAIMLNCKNPKQFMDVYEKAIEKHFTKQMKAEGVNINQ